MKSGENSRPAPQARLPNDYCFFTGQVLMPTMAYSGQKPMALVNTNTPPKTNSTMPNVPLIILVKYRMAITAAIKSLTITSAVPMFFFISIDFICYKFE
jgi:hypothetical protein